MSFSAIKSQNAQLIRLSINSHSLYLFGYTSAMTTKQRKPNKSAKRIADDDFVKAYTQSGFCHTRTIAALDISRSAYYEALRMRDDLSAAMSIARQQIAGIAESALLSVLRDPKHKDHTKVAMFLASAHDRETYGAQAKIDIAATVKFDASPLLKEIALKHSGDEPIDTVAVKVDNLTNETELDFLD